MWTKFIIFTVYCFLWLALTGLQITSGSFLLAVTVACCIYYSASKLNLLSFKNSFNASGLVRYCVWLFKEILFSAWQVSKIAWSRHIFITPAIQTIKSSQDTDLGVVVYANSITLTPGTATIAQKENGLLVHVLDVSFLDGLKDGVMDKKIKNIIRS
ncbi:MAG TPA: Na+/H+ antiporter subunit E [Candidatus Megaira endosymbiont of Nemacystus decipiens]|nr:Na+/H+ antiporter subunit E [Candidatus Megaera endosymbiont of Nemacystus decipiens]